MDVFLMIRRKKLTIFTDAKDTTTVLELKKMIEGILKVTPQSQMLFNKDSQLMDDEKTLAEYGLTSATAKAQSPAPIGLALRWINTKRLCCGLDETDASTNLASQRFCNIPSSFD
ncbi:unnamed protein product [Spodoptera littoralis]|uniref:Ubiquitin-like domain-containing protein n=1 Tax=Spodoptera littoralis TaxID=7109 RepID=A0A9P0MW36_SPOLI|nr:unnamed protein product [Spodoptera littoralis]CAH1635521.1 unnamed protein product [Spodoptera littoralis]